MLLETDAPYLAPAPYRGKRNESSYIPLIAEKIADTKNRGVAEVARVTTENAAGLFNF
jgi:TatD DNase family protein